MAGGRGPAAFHGPSALNRAYPGYAGRGAYGRGYRYGYYYRHGHRYYRYYYGYPYWVGFGFYGYPYGYPYGYDYDYYGYDPDYDYNAAVNPRNRVTPSIAVVVQAELARQGYYDGKVDGIVGDATRRAVREYQADRGLPVTGEITPALVGSQRKH